MQREDTPEARLAKLEQGLQAAGLPLVEAVPLLAVLLTIPVPERYPPLLLSPQRQRQQTQENPPTGYCAAQRAVLIRVLLAIQFKCSTPLTLLPGLPDHIAAPVL